MPYLDRAPAHLLRLPSTLKDTQSVQPAPHSRNARRTVVLRPEDAEVLRVIQSAHVRVRGGHQRAEEGADG